MNKKPPLPKSLSKMGTPKPGMPVPNNSRDDRNRIGLKRLRDTVQKDKKNVKNIKSAQSAVEGMTPAGKKALSSEIGELNKIRKKPLKRAGGGMMKKKGYKMGGAMKKKGYAMGGAMKKKGYSKGGKLRGNGIAVRGFRAGKMVTMKGS